MNSALQIPRDVSLRRESSADIGRVLTPEALAFVAGLTRRFSARIAEQLEARRSRQLAFDHGDLPEFSSATSELRAANWKVAKLPDELADRRVEITGPVERKMVINALNSGANAFMADFEDATAPTFDNLIQGQINLMDAVRRTIRFVANGGKSYELCERPAILFVRPRGLHLPEKHLYVDELPVPGALFDFGLYLFHNAEALRQNGSAPYFYLPKLESYLEARIWRDVFVSAERTLRMAPGTIKATVLIETLPAAFQMDEILFELRDHSAGLNCGRWDYIFSFIKKRRQDPRAVLPDRGEITMDRGFLRAYARLLIETCHRRGAHAMGGMAAQIPIKEDSERNAEAMRRVQADKLREVTDGHDGTWVAHPALVPIARAVFDEHMPGPNQIQRERPASGVTAADLLLVPDGPRTLRGLLHNVRVAIAYLEAWLCGNGCVPLYHLMEDAATAEIARAQVWQWLRHAASLDTGEVVTRELLRAAIARESAELEASAGSGDRLFRVAAALFETLSLDPTFPEFLTLPAYEALLARGA